MPRGAWTLGRDPVPVQQAFSGGREHEEVLRSLTDQDWLFPSGIMASDALGLDDFLETQATLDTEWELDPQFGPNDGYGWTQESASDGDSKHPEHRKGMHRRTASIAGEAADNLASSPFPPMRSRRQLQTVFIKALQRFHRAFGIAALGLPQW